MNYKYHITRAVDSSANENHEKYDSDVSYDYVSRYCRAPDMNKYRDVMDYVQSFNLIPHSICDKVLNLLDENNELWEDHDWYNMVKNSNQNTYAAESDEIKPDSKYEVQMLNLGFSSQRPNSRNLKKKFDKILMPYGKDALEMYQNKFSTIEMDNTGKVTPLGSQLFSLRYQQYDTGVNMKIHYDLNHSLFASCQKYDQAVPTLTICGYLTQQGKDYEGGDFVVRGNVVPVNKGDIVIFPCTFLYPHEVSDVTEVMTKNKRTMCSTWFW